MNKIIDLCKTKNYIKKIITDTCSYLVHTHTTRQKINLQQEQDSLKILSRIDEIPTED